MSYFKIFSKLLSLILLVFSFAFAQTEVSGLINTNTTWDSTGSPYIVVGNIAVMNATLNIESGVEVRFNDGFHMQIMTGGEIKSEGTSDDSVTFIWLNTTPGSGSIEFQNGAIPSVVVNDTIYQSGSYFSYCNFRDFGLYAPAIYSPVDLFINNCNFSSTHNDGDAIKIYAELTVNKTNFKNFSSAIGGGRSNKNIKIYNSIFQDLNGYVFHPSGHKNSILIFNNNIIKNCSFGIRYMNNQDEMEIHISYCTFDSIQYESFRYEDSNYGGELNLYVESSTFSNNINEGAIISTAPFGTVQINNCSFINNHSNKSGGSIKLPGSSNHNNFQINNSVFIRSSSESSGGAISGGIDVFNSEFIECTSQASAGAVSGGGGNVYDCFFKSDTAFGGGCGAAGIGGSYNSIYVNNYAEGDGGAVGGHEIIDNVFLNNYAVGNGGALKTGRSASFEGIISGNIFSLNSTESYGAAIYNIGGSYGNEIVIVDSNYFYNNECIQSNDCAVIYGNFEGSRNIFNENSDNYIINTGYGSSTLNLKNNYWGIKDSITIEDSLIYDLLDDPNFSRSLVDYNPFLLAPSKSSIGIPNDIDSTSLHGDNSYTELLSNDIFPGDSIFIKISATDIDTFSSNLAIGIITNISTNDTIITTLSETERNNGIFVNFVTIDTISNNSTNIIGASIGDILKIFSREDTTKQIIIPVGGTPPPQISLLTIDDQDDIFHIIDSNPNINWSYSDPLSTPQTSYNIQVGLDTNWSIAEMWNTGEISSSDTFVVYAGSALNEDSTYYVRACVYNGTFWSGWIDTSFALNSHPQMELIDTSVSEDDTLFFNVNDFLSDSDDHDSLLNVSSSGSDNIVVNINMSSHEASLIPAENWNGSEEIGFTCSDPWGFQTVDSLTLTVLPVNDEPEISTTELPNATEDQEYSFTIEATDVDMVYGDHLTYNLTVYPEGMTINSTNGEISWPPDNDDVGDTTVTIVVSDDSSATDVKTYTLTVENVNDPPIFTSFLPDTSFDEDTILELPLSVWFDYVEDIDNADSTLVWSIEENDSVFTLISANKVVFSSPLNWYGKDSLKVIVTDEEFSDTTNLIVAVDPVNDAPVISDIPDTSFIEDDSISFDLDNYVFDVDNPNSSLTWDVSLIDGDGLLLSTGQNNDVLTKSYRVANRYVSKKSANIKSKGTSFNNKFTGSSITTTADSQTSGVASEEGSIKVVIDPVTHIVTFSATDDYFVENVPFLFTVNDTSSASDTDTMRITISPVNDAPILSAIPDTSFDEDNRLTVDLSYFYTYVDDPDNADSTLSFVFNGADYINASASGDSLLLYAQANWNGVDTIEVIVNDESLSDTASWKIIVNPVNDAPVITSVDSISATEDRYFKYLATAIDIEDSSIIFFFDDLPCWLSSDVDSIYGIPSEGMKDTSFVVIAGDGELKDTLTVLIKVIAVNDPPVISTIPDTSFNEDEQLKFAISYFYDFVYDPDNADSSLVWSFSDTDYVYVIMDEDSVTLSSQIDWFGKDTLSAKVSDGEFFDEASFVITVRPVNDPPCFAELMPDSISFDSNVRDTLLLTGLASDVDNPDSTLNWSYIRSSFVRCHINDTMKTAIFWVEENMSGQDTVVLSVYDGEFTVYDSLIVIVNPVSGIEYLMSQIPNEYSLKQNYPNPFNPTTTIIYGLPKSNHVDIRIYDLLGREVTTLVNDNQEAKHYKVIWDAKDRSGNDVPSGMYLYRIVAKSGDSTFLKTKKLLLLR